MLPTRMQLFSRCIRFLSLKQTRNSCGCSSRNSSGRAIIGAQSCSLKYRSRPKESQTCERSGILFSRFSTASSGGTVDDEEINRFNQLAGSMWNDRGEMGGLHSMNRLRVPLIRDALVRQRSAHEMASVPASEPLRGMKVMDVGCGGGILSEPLARLGAEVTGLDAAQENITVAKWHSSLDPATDGKIRYLSEDVEDFASRGAEIEKYDGVVASEIMEHVVNPDSFTRACCTLVKPGGSVFITTINKTAASFLLGKVAAEYILRIVPVDMHDWNKFVSPEEVQDLLSQNGMSTRLIHGMMWNPLNNKWFWIKSTDLSYAIHATKHLDSDSGSSSDSDS